MKKYHHITNGDRWQIYALLREWKTNEEIGKILWFDRTAIRREIVRNSHNGEYEPEHAQREYDRRRSEINKWRCKLKNNPKILEEVKRCLMKEMRAPHVIAGRKKKDGKKMVCASTIFTYIKEREPSLKVYLKYKKWYKKRWRIETRGKPKENYMIIDERAQIVDNRERIGDVEVDTIHSSWAERKWWMATIVDRKTKYLAGWKVEVRTAKAVWDVLIREMLLFPKEKLFTITADNGKEFYDFERVASVLKVLFYFAHPYASCERATNEQTNGMLRVFFPKWTDFSKISEAEIQEVIRIINHKPRKSLNYLCAHEAFYGVKLNL
jgi:transposase, IS30 family